MNGGGHLVVEEPDHPLRLPAEPIQTSSLGALPLVGQRRCPVAGAGRPVPGRGLVQTLPAVPR